MENVIEVRDLVRRFRRKEALRGVSLDVPRGCVYGLVGENGAGKTTLLNHILGSMKPQSGTVRVFGRDPVGKAREVLSQIGYLSEVRDLPGWMRIQELMRYTRAFYPNWDQEYANELVDTFGLDAREKIKNLSRGQLALAGLLNALAHRPPLLVLDEPSSGLDPVVRREILGAIIRTVAEEGRTILFSSHLLEEVERVADHVTMMANGRVVLSEDIDALRAQHCRFVVRFEQALDVPPTVDGALCVTGSRHEWTVVCNGERERVSAAIGSLRGQIIDEAPPNLEEIFVARVKSAARAS